MTIWDRLRGILKSEAKDVGEGLSDAHDKLDRVLTQKERELNATPTERMDMVLDDIAESEDRFDAIVDKAEGRGSVARAESEVSETVARTKNSTGDSAPDLAERLDTPAAAQPGAGAAQAVAPQANAVDPTVGSSVDESSAEADESSVTALPGGLEYVADDAPASDAATPTSAAPASSGPSDAVAAGMTSGMTSGMAAGMTAEEAAEAQRKAAAEAARLEAERERRILLDSRKAAADAKFEQQKERAGDILDELRGELGLED